MPQLRLSLLTTSSFSQVGFFGPLIEMPFFGSVTFRLPTSSSRLNFVHTFSSPPEGRAFFSFSRLQSDPSFPFYQLSHLPRREAPVRAFCLVERLLRRRRPSAKEFIRFLGLGVVENRNCGFSTRSSQINDAWKLRRRAKSHEFLHCIAQAEGTQSSWILKKNSSSLRKNEDFELVFMSSSAVGLHPGRWC
ncbi:Uncharacterized protein Rs2_35129 [Raphanus sativus]|nr:Uncharacterized protein Rs2_35129 [Raphanus sativus]